MPFLDIIFSLGSSDVSKVQSGGEVTHTHSRFSGMVQVTLHVLKEGLRLRREKQSWTE